jgi:hypothetical protein
MDIAIGLTWDAPGGQRTVEGITDTPHGPRYMVRQAGDRFVDLLDAAQVRRSREVDTANLVYRRQAEAEADILAAKEAEAAARREDLDGFDAGMSRLQRGRTLETLSRQVSYKGRIVSRRDLIREKVAAGAYIETDKAGARRLIFQEGIDAHFDQATITKIGMDYAAHLIRQI